MTNKCKQKYIDDPASFIEEYELITRIDKEKNPNRNIIKTPSEKYAVKYNIKRRTYHVGTYNTFAEAVVYRDAFEANRDNWPYGVDNFYETIFREKEQANKYNGISQVSSGRWRLNFNINGRAKYIGTYDTKEEAANIRARLLKGEAAWR